MMRQHPQKGGLVLLGGTLHDEHRMADQPDKPPPCQPRCPARTATAPETKRPIAKPRLRKLACGPVAHGGQMVQPPEAMQFIHRFGGAGVERDRALAVQQLSGHQEIAREHLLATRKHPKAARFGLRGDGHGRAHPAQPTRGQPVHGADALGSC